MFTRFLLVTLLIASSTKVIAFTQFDRSDEYDLSGYKVISEPIRETAVGLLAVKCELNRKSGTIIIFMNDDGMHFTLSDESKKFFKNIKTLTEIEPYNFLFEDDKKKTSIYLKKADNRLWKLVKNRSGDFSSHQCEDHTETILLLLNSLDLQTIELLQKLN